VPQARARQITPAPLTEERNGPIIVERLRSDAAEALALLRAEALAREPLTFDASSGDDKARSIDCVRASLKDGWASAVRARRARCSEKVNTTKSC
jgi:hypothetical protein